MFCKNCGSEIKETDKFCEECGCKIDYFDNNQTDDFVDNDINAVTTDNTKVQVKRRLQKRKTLAVILAVLLVFGMFSYVGVNIVKNGKYLYKYNNVITGSSYTHSYTETYRQDGYYPLSEVTVDISDGLTEKTEENYEYGSSGKVETIYVNDSEDGEATVSIEYSQINDEYVGTGYWSDGSGSVEYIYDNKSRLISYTEYDNDGSYTTQTYNSDEQLIESILVSESTEMKFVYEYDKNGKTSKRYSYVNEILTETCEYSYYNFGFLKTSKTIEFADNEETESHIYTSTSQIEKQSSNTYKLTYYDDYDENNEISSYVIIVLDNSISKNVIKAEHFYDQTDDEPAITTEYEYKWRDFTKADTWKDVLF